MLNFLGSLASILRDQERPRLPLQLEILDSRNQLAVHKRTAKRPRIRPADRIFWSWISRVWPAWRDALVFVRPETVIAWRRKKFKDYWRRLSLAGNCGRPAVSREIRYLIRRMSAANPLWGAPHIVGELRKIGIDLAKSTVEKYMVRPRQPPSPTWHVFLGNHIEEIVAIDFFVAPTVRNQVLSVFLLLAHERRRILHFNATSNPTAAWTAQQIVEAFPWDDVPRYLLRDRDAIYGTWFARRVENMGIEQVVTSPRSRWQNAYVERLIGTIRRECLDHVIVINERHVNRILTAYFRYYHAWRTHQALDMNCPEGRPVHTVNRGRVVEIPEVGGLHHHSERVAA